MVFGKLNPFAKLPEAEGFLEEHAVGAYNRLAPPTDKMTTFAVKQKLLSLTGQSMSIKDNEGNLIASIDGKIFTLRDRCVIFGADGRPACCIIQKILSMSPAYFIYSFKPYFNGQKPTGEKQDGKDLYAWAKVWKRLVAVTDEFEICMAVNDNEYQQPEHGLFKAVAPSMLSPKLMVKKDGRGCALVERRVIDFGELIDMNGWMLTVSKGIDPILMIALISVKDAIKDE
uniref:Phospholipid scramblase n=1 Tax=Haptolina ericina TaxID=156174 RepID=A0A7S3ACR7_9EUKA